MRGNALIPTVEPPEYLTDNPFDLVTFDAYLLSSGSFDLRDTDGLTRISASLEGSQLNILLEGVKQKTGLRFIPRRGAPSVDTVYANGLALRRVDILEIRPDAIAGWTSDEGGTIRVMLRSEARVL